MRSPFAAGAYCRRPSFPSKTSLLSTALAIFAMHITIANSADRIPVRLLVRALLCIRSLRSFGLLVVVQKEEQIRNSRLRQRVELGIGAFHCQRRRRIKADVPVHEREVGVRVELIGRLLSVSCRH